MRVVYLNPCGQLGGAETSLLELLASIRVAAPDWELWLVLGEDGPLANEARERGVQVAILPFPRSLARLGDARMRPWKTLGCLLQAAAGTAPYRARLARILKSLQPDIIHTNGFKMHVLGAWIGPRRAPLVWHIHDYVGTRKLTRHLLRVFHKACRIAIANSESVASDLRRVIPGLTVTPIYNAIDLERFSPAGPKLDLDAMSGLSPASSGAVRVGLVATFARWKGHKVFLEALARLSPDVPVRAYIVGGPIYQTAGSQFSQRELEVEVDRLGLRGRVGFTGFVRDTAPAIRALDIVVHASTEPEPFGMVIAEAMACAKPVIASQAGGASELFKDGEDGLGHPPGDDAVLAAQILRLVRDQPLRQRIGNAGRVTAEQLYQGKRLAKEMLAAYRQTGDRSGHAQSGAAVPSASL